MKDNRKARGTQLAKVLWYYNLMPESSQGSQKIVCPFHDDVNPSMIIDFDEGSWYCFGCNKSGDAVKFVQLLEKQENGLNDLKAYQKFLKIQRSKKCSKISVKSFVKKKRGTKLELLDEAHDFYYCLRSINWLDIDDEEIAEVCSYMRHRGFRKKTLNKCKAKYTYNKNYPIVFPMLDNGEFKGYVCRTTDKKVEEKRKYLYNEGFSRATTLVGEYGKKKYVFVVEGYMDRLKFVQFGISNVVAILGWKMSNEQIMKLKEAGVTDIISALDNDKYGRQGTKYLKKFFNVTRFSYLKGIKDPGDMNKNTFMKMFNRTMMIYKGDK